MSNPVEINTQANQGPTFLNSDLTDNQFNFDYSTTIFGNSKDSNFSKIKFDNDSNLPCPIFTNELQGVLEEYRILIISSSSNFDQTYFGRQLVKRLHEKYDKHTPIELIQSDNSSDLFKQTEALEKGQIILFNDIHPKNINYDFKKIAHLSAQSESYYIVTSDLSRDMWEKCVGFKEQYYFEVPETDHYESSEIERWFLKEINENPPFYLEDQDNIDVTNRISQSLKVSDLLKTLPNPIRLRNLIQQYKNVEHYPTDKQLIKEVQHLTSNDQEYISQWFNNLAHDEKIIALTAAICNGSFHDQYFEIVEKLCENQFWKSSCPSLAHIDFNKLNFLPKRANETRFREGVLLLSYYNNFRLIVIDLAMRDYPRHLESLLRGLMEVARTSFTLDKFDNWVLYGTSLKRGLLRQVFVEASKDVNYHNFLFIENIYLELASDKRGEIQDLAAKCIAKLRELNRDDFLFSTIDSWLNNHEIKMQVYLYLRRNSTDEDAGHHPLSYLKATIIRVLAYAADYDKPNELHDKILDYLFELVEDKSSYVQTAIRNMLPRFIHHNIHKLKNRLHSLMKRPKLSQAISRGLADSYRNYPSDTKHLLQEWLEVAQTKIKKHQAKKSLYYEEVQLITLIRTLQKIKVGAISNPDGFQLKELYKKVIDLQKHHTKKPIWEEIVLLIASLQLQDFSEGFENSQKTLSALNKDDRKVIVDEWTKAYLKQRAKLNSDNAQIILTVEKTQFPIWMKKSLRPLTQIEEELLKWVNSSKRIAQSYATLAFLAFAQAFDHHEEEAIQLLLKREKEQELREQADLNVDTISFRQPAKSTKLDFLMRIKLFFYTLFEKREHRKALKEIVKLLVSTNGYTSNDLQLVIEKWKAKSGNDELANKLAKWLDRLF